MKEGCYITSCGSSACSEEVPFPQKRNSLDYDFFKKRNYWIFTIHGQFPLKCVLDHNVNHLNTFQHNLFNYSPLHRIDIDPNVLLWGYADLGSYSFSIEPYFDLKPISTDAPSLTESEIYITCKRIHPCELKLS